MHQQPKFLCPWRFLSVVFFTECRPVSRQCYSDRLTLVLDFIQRRRKKASFIPINLFLVKCNNVCQWLSLAQVTLFISLPLSCFLRRASDCHLDLIPCRIHKTDVVCETQARACCRLTSRGLCAHTRGPTLSAVIVVLLFTG